MSRMRTAQLALVVGVAACAGLLGVRPRTEQVFPHRAHVLKGVACVQCHTTTAKSDATGPAVLPAASSCLPCHAKPHDNNPCGDCHGRHEDRLAVAAAKQHLRFSHADHKATTAGNCIRCHEAVGSSDGPLRPSMATCLSCHEHRVAWDSRACTPCHVNMEAEGTRPASHVVHGEDFMTRHGMAATSSRDLCSSCHAESECAGCHGANVPALPSTLHFEDVSRPDMHAAGFMARHSIEAKLDPALCTTCHRDQSYCRDCHERRGLLSVSPEHGSPHPAGWVGTGGGGSPHGSAARMNPVSCASCHGGAGESLCVGCHRVGGAGGNPHPPGFHSSKPMHDLPCRMCHQGAT
jgi:hypothetical protein